MVTMFEEAYKQQPTNEELGVQTFFANVRANHWKSAQQAGGFDPILSLLLPVN
jgi:N-terminal acetyltransferase B complex non-catalytic subunit